LSATSEAIVFLTLVSSPLAAQRSEQSWGASDPYGSGAGYGGGAASGGYSQSAGSYNGRGYNAPAASYGESRYHY